MSTVCCQGDMTVIIPHDASVLGLSLQSDLIQGFEYTHQIMLEQKKR